MNAKQEFIKAIMQVLRLEANIYTMGAIEEIIERLEISDYTLFIAYLGERKADYEKPIESIAKGVDEFYEIKMEPLRDASNKKADEIAECIYSYMSNKDNHLDNILRVVFTRYKKELRVSKEDLALARSCNSFQKFEDSGFASWQEVRSELFDKLMHGKRKPTILRKIQLKSEDMAEKTLGICLKTLAKPKASELI